MYKKPNVDVSRHDKLVQDAVFYEYSTAANPLEEGFIPEVPIVKFPHGLHEEGPTRVIPLDVSERLKCPYPATSPIILAHFIRILSGENIKTSPNATSEVYYVIRGNGHTTVGETTIPWNTGDFFSLPACSAANHCADSDTAFYWVTDEPLLNYLGVKAAVPKFEPTLYLEELAFSKLGAVEAAQARERKSRVSVLLGNTAFPQTRTITHTLWTMFGVLPVNEIQYPHRHQSVAVDFVIECQPDCYTLIGKELDDKNEIIDPFKADWSPGSVFITPPGYWHSHHNESGVQAHLMPMQDAGLYTYLRTLDIKFTHGESYISLKP